jgi:hypothetical protein
VVVGFVVVEGGGGVVVGFVVVEGGGGVVVGFDIGFCSWACLLSSWACLLSSWACLLIEAIIGGACKVLLSCNDDLANETLMIYGVAIMLDTKRITIKASENTK